MNNLDIDSTIKECLNGHKESYCKIIRQFQKQIYSFCYQFTKTPQDAEDATTEIFIKVFNSLPSFNTGNQFSSWLYRIAYNYLVDQSRRKTRELKYLNSLTLNEDECTETQNPSTIFFKNNEAKNIKKIIDTLPLKYRTVLMLKYYQDLSYHQISEVMKIPKQSVGTLVLRGKKLLREKLLENRGTP